MFVAIKPNSSTFDQSNLVDKRVKHSPKDYGSDAFGGSQSDLRIAASSSPVVFESPTRTQLLIKLSALIDESVDSLRLNTILASALDRHPERVDDALEYFQQAIATWKNKPGIGLFIHAVKSGQKPSLTKPGSGWKEWADEAVKRRLMEYSQSHEGDIMVHLVGGVSKLWSQLCSLPWSEIELIAAGGIG